ARPAWRASRAVPWAPTDRNLSTLPARRSTLPAPVAAASISDAVPAYSKRASGRCPRRCRECARETKSDDEEARAGGGDEQDECGLARAEQGEQPEALHEPGHGRGDMIRERRRCAARDAGPPPRRGESQRA